MSGVCRLKLDEARLKIGWKHKGCLLYISRKIFVPQRSSHRAGVGDSPCGIRFGVGRITGKVDGCRIFWWGRRCIEHGFVIFATRHHIGDLGDEILVGWWLGRTAVKQFRWCHKTLAEVGLWLCKRSVHYISGSRPEAARANSYKPKINSPEEQM